MRLSNFDLLKIANDLKIPIKLIVAKDELPNKPKIGYYIVNLQSSYAGDGSHWVVIIIKNDVSFYFDAFGELPPIEVEKFGKFKNNKLFYNTFQIQNLESSLCGFYCIALFKYIEENNNKNLIESCDDFINLFKVNTLFNAKILKIYLTQFNFSLEKYLLKNK